MLEKLESAENEPFNIGMNIKPVKQHKTIFFQPGASFSSSDWSHVRNKVTLISFFPADVNPFCV